jgi:hypothetical protein
MLFNAEKRENPPSRFPRIGAEWSLLMLKMIQYRTRQQKEIKAQVDINTDLYGAVISLTPVSLARVFARKLISLFLYSFRSN